jgi:D-lyxose ketol-isomerase
MDTGVVLTDKEKDAIEIADFGLSRFPEIGLSLLVYVNTDRVCAKELMMFPNMNCVEHSHPDISGKPGKEETFRCRWGKVYLYVPGTDQKKWSMNPPEDRKAWYTAAKEIVLEPGQQYVMPPNTKHWFQAGPEGAVISEFSSSSCDEMDVFTDPEVKRVTVIGD